MLKYVVLSFTNVSVHVHSYFDPTPIPTLTSSSSFVLSLSQLEDITTVYGRDVSLGALPAGVVISTLCSLHRKGSDTGVDISPLSVV